MRIVLKTRKKKEYATKELFLMNQLLMHLELTKTIVDIADVESLMLTNMNPKLKKLHEGFIEIDMIKKDS